jgi:cytoskeletal protein CcmA (bactofilin family)
MFNQTKKGDAKGLMPTSNINLIGNGTTINGDIACEGDIRIDGQVNGLVSTKAKIVVGPEGEINGDMVCQSADILGKGITLPERQCIDQRRYIHRAF